eukprot:537765-Pyramimonas_sp.AAC.1
MLIKKLGVDLVALDVGAAGQRGNLPVDPRPAAGESSRPPLPRGHGERLAGEEGGVEGAPRHQLGFGV